MLANMLSILRLNYSFHHWWMTSQVEVNSLHLSEKWWMKTINLDDPRVNLDVWLNSSTSPRLCLIPNCFLRSRPPWIHKKTQIQQQHQQQQGRNTTVSETLVLQTSIKFSVLFTKQWQVPAVSQHQTNHPINCWQDSLKPWIQNYYCFTWQWWSTCISFLLNYQTILNDSTCFILIKQSLVWTSQDTWLLQESWWK